MRIPKVLHFCFGFSPLFGHKPWSLVHHVSVASAIQHIRPDEAFMYYEHRPTGPWWDLSCKLFTLVRIDAPRTVFGNKVAHPAHRADVVRLNRLFEVGGIYLDADVFVHRSFDALLDNPAVLGQQGENGSYGLANAIILSEPGSEFIDRWYDSYRTFRSRGRDEYWDEHSVKIPALLAARHPDLITILPHRAFFWPRWHTDHLKMIFGTPSVEIVTDATFATHLWETHAWSYVENLTPGQVRRIDSRFHQWARPYLVGLHDDFGAPTTQDRISLLYRKPYLLLEDLSQKLMRGGRIIIQGRPTPRIADQKSRLIKDERK